jgi:hypothetical protein
MGSSGVDHGGIVCRRNESDRGVFASPREETRSSPSGSLSPKPREPHIHWYQSCLAVPLELFAGATSALVLAGYWPGGNCYD